MTEWRGATLSDIGTVQSGFAFKSRDWVDSGVPVIKIQNVRNGHVNLSGCSFVSPEVAKSADRFRLSYGDVLITMSGEIGSVGIVRTHEPLLLNQRVGRVRLYEEDPNLLRFVGYSLQRPDLKSAMETVAYGVAQPNISPILLASLPIYLPSEETQQIVGEVLRSLDDLIENNQWRIGLLEQMARAAHREWFTRSRYPSIERTIFKDSPLGPLPETWRVCRLDEACEFTDGKPITKEQRTHGDVVVYGANGPIGVTYLPAAFSSCIVMGKIGSCGALHRAVGPSWVTNNAFAVKAASWRSDYFAWLGLNEIDFTPLVGGAANPYLPKKNFGHLLVTCPPPESIDKFHSVVAPVFGAIDSLSDQNRVLTRIRDLLLPKLVTGQIDVSELDLEAAVRVVA